MSAASARERLADHLHKTGAGHPLAIGWATVEMERAVFELGDSLGLRLERFADAPDSQLLGARCRIAHRALAGAIGLILLEPSTESRLAAFLARHDEGPAAVWLSEVSAARTVGSLSPREAGPLGLERLYLDGPRQGPYRLLVSEPGTIAP